MESLKQPDGDLPSLFESPNRADDIDIQWTDEEEILIEEDDEISIQEHQEPNLAFCNLFLRKVVGVQQAQNTHSTHEISGIKFRLLKPDRAVGKEKAAPSNYLGTQTLKGSEGLVKAAIDQLGEPDEKARLDPAAHIISSFLIECKFDSNGFELHKNAWHSFGIRLQHTDGVIAAVLRWCPLSKFYLNHLLKMNKKITINYIGAVEDGDVDYGSFRRRALVGFGPFVEILKLSLRDQSGEINRPISTVWDFLRPGRLYPYMSFLRQWACHPAAAVRAETIKVKLTELKQLIKWVQKQPWMWETSEQFWRHREKELIPDEMLNHFCATREQLNDCKRWAETAKQDLEYALVAIDRAAPRQPHLPRESQLVSSGEFFEVAAFKRTHWAIINRMNHLSRLRLSSNNVAEFQELLIAVSILASGGSRRQVAMAMRNNLFHTQNVGRREVLYLHLESVEEKRRRLRTNKIPIVGRYKVYFEKYRDEILPLLVKKRTSKEGGSHRFWRCPTNGDAMEPAEFTAIHQRVWHSYGVRVAKGCERSVVPKRFGPRNIRRWIPTQIGKSGWTTKLLGLCSEVMNTTEQKLTQQYDRKNMELVQMMDFMEHIVFGTESTPESADEDGVSCFGLVEESSAESDDDDDECLEEV